MTKIVATLPDGKICDYIDQKIRNDTPEEYVRQNIERRLVLELGFSREQIAVEFPIKILGAASTVLTWRSFQRVPTTLKTIFSSSSNASGIRSNLQVNKRGRTN